MVMSWEKTNARKKKKKKGVLCLTDWGKKGLDNGKEKEGKNVCSLFEWGAVVR